MTMVMASGTSISSSYDTNNETNTTGSGKKGKHPLAPLDLARLQRASPDVYRFDAPSTTTSSATPSPSRSPRHSRNFSQSHDPLLRDLSPTSTLRAFTQSSSAACGKTEDQLTRSIENASASERALGARIAETCKDIKAWYTELSRWEWSNTFEAPPEARGDNAEYWGSLPAEVVVSYEKRIEEITDALEELDVESLKEYVLNADIYAQHSTRADQSSSTLQLQRLDDFTALITATILQALPFLSRLNSLLSAWSVRLVLLRKIPAFLSGLEDARTEIERGWTEMRRLIDHASDSSSETGPDHLRSEFAVLKRKLEKKVVKLGTRLDSMLDDLEGREETLPDPWIDAFETLEASFGEWVMQSERELMSRDLGLAVKAPAQHSAAHSEDAVGLGLDLRSLPQQDPAPSAKQAILGADSTPRNTETDGEDSYEQPESPVLGSGNTASCNTHHDDNNDDDDDASDAGSVASGKETITQFSEAPIPLSPSASLRIPKQTTSSPARMRHIPIVVHYDEKEAVMETAAPADKERAKAAAPSNEPQELDAGSKVRARVALFSGVDQTQRLQKAVSPVRPFEHASSAFTKLFQRTNSMNSLGHSRSSSTSSRTSLRKGLGIKGKNEDSRRFHEKNPSVSSTRSKRSMTEPIPPSPIRDFTAASPVELDAGQPSSAASPVKQALTSAPRFEGDMYTTPETDQGYFPSTRGSKSTIESAWNSPALSDFPENWPLPLRLTYDETASPKKAINADDFERMFVDSLPVTPNGNEAHERENPLDDMRLQHAHADVPREVVDETALASSANQAQTAGFTPAAAKPRPRHVPLFANQPAFRFFSPTSDAVSPASFQSAISTPEVHSASTVGYFRPKDVFRPSTAGAVLTTTEVPGLHEMDGGARDDGAVIRRASTASIENHSRSELRTVDVSDLPRRTSTSTSPPSTSSPSSQDSGSYLNSTPGTEAVQSAVVDEGSDSDHRNSLEQSPSFDLKMPKRRLVLEDSPEQAPAARQDRMAQTTPIKKKHAHSNSGVEQFDRHVSRVLSSLPARIHFTPIDNVSEPSTSPSKGHSRTRQSLSSKPSRTGLTLSPAQTDGTPKKSASSDPDIKLYHLTQEGKSQPIKLYVRLVGEGERVMVRVGGGWADLGEYLRQYAEHHGRRAVSDTTRLEVQGVANSKTSQGKLRTPLSRPGSVLDSPSSVLSHRRSSTALHSTTSSPMMRPVDEGVKTPSPPGSRGRNDDTPSESSSKPRSRPSTADAAAGAARPGSAASWVGGDIGLAGPAARSGKKNPELDEHKAKWVEDMVAQAKQASIEKKRADERMLDMGRRGGTRRLIFRRGDAGN